jgi:hypothetical protein
MLGEGRRGCTKRHYAKHGRGSDTGKKSLEQGGRFHNNLFTLTVGGAQAAQRRQAASVNPHLSPV